MHRYPTSTVSVFTQANAPDNGAGTKILFPKLSACAFFADSRLLDCMNLHAKHPRMALRGTNVIFSETPEPRNEGCKLRSESAPPNHLNA